MLPQDNGFIHALTHVLHTFFPFFLQAIDTNYQYIAYLKALSHKLTL
jgi:hypothetical protein